MPASARAAVLARVRAAVRSAPFPSEEPPPAGAAPLRPAGPADPGVTDLLPRMVLELEAVGVTVLVEETEGAVRDRVAQILCDRRVLSWDSQRLPYGLGAILHPDRTISVGAGKAAKGEAEVGLTGVHAGIAETGSLLLLSRAGEPRTASLLPPHHVGVLRRGDLFPTLESWLAGEGGALAAVSALVLITGTSRTADIELVLTRGVHGPGAVTVVIGP